MKNKGTIKGFIAGVVLTALLASGVSVFAAGTVQITVTQDRDVKIIFHGEEQVLKDANGVRVYPLSYDGTIYVPIRAISQLFNEPVSWDGDTRSAIIGSAESAPASGDVYTIGNSTPFTFSGYSYQEIGSISGKALWTTNIDSVVVESAARNDKGETVLNLTVAGRLSDVSGGGSGKLHIRVVGLDAYGSEINFGTKEDSITANKDGSAASGKITMRFPKDVVKVRLDTSSAQEYLF
jgi:hypothetical protein